MSRRQRRLGYRLAAAGLALIAFLTLIPEPEAAASAASTPITCLVCGDLGGLDVLLNVLLFVPLGLGLALAGFSWRRAVLLAALLSLTVELLQVTMIAGRDASLGDVLTNALGGGVGSLIGLHWRSLVFPGPGGARRLALTYALLLGWIWAGTAWALGPTWPTGSPWYGQWAPQLRHMKPFLGTPLLIVAGGEPLLPGRAIDQGRLEDAVAANPVIAFRAVLGPRPAQLAPVGSIFDAHKREVLLLGQDRQDLAFRYRMRASIVRLRTPLAILRDGMSGNPGDTVEAEGALRNGALELRSRLQGDERSRRLPLSASWGWALITPWESILGEGVRLLTALWIIGLVAILAYWSALAGRAALAIPPVTMLLLLGAIPRAAGFPPSYWTEWMAALIGVFLGLLASRPALPARARASVPDYVEESPMLTEATG